MEPITDRQLQEAVSVDTITDADLFEAFFYHVELFIGMIYRGSHMKRASLCVISVRSAFIPTADQTSQSNYRPIAISSRSIGAPLKQTRTIPKETEKDPNALYWKKDQNMVTCTGPSMDRKQLKRALRTAALQT